MIKYSDLLLINYHFKSFHKFNWVFLDPSMEKLFLNFQIFTYENVDFHISYVFCNIVEYLPNEILRKMYEIFANSLGSF